MKKKLQIVLNNLKSSFPPSDYFFLVAMCVERYANGEGELEDLISGKISKEDYGEFITVNTKWGNIDFHSSEGYPTHVDRMCAFWHLIKGTEKAKINIIFPAEIPINIDLAATPDYTEWGQGITFDVTMSTLSQILANKYYER
jgi:hypothetical protein